VVVKVIELIESPIDANQVLSLVHDPECGAEVLFVGTTRQWTVLPTNDQPTALQRVETSHLVYEAYRQMALVQMEKLEVEARNRWPIRRLAMVHRLGQVAASEASVAIAVSCPHRSEAFEAAKWLIDQLKHQVPIWKQEHYVQHGAEWIHPTAGNCHCGSDSKVVVANDNASAFDGNELVNHSQTACAENSGTVHLQAEASRP
jgi:molybdopterin synthase catalytic subunit